MRAEGTLHLFTREAGKTRSFPLANPAKRPPLGDIGAGGDCLVRIFPRGGKIEERACERIVGRDRYTRVRVV